MINKLVWILDPGWSAQAMGPFAVIDNNYRLSNQEYLEYIAENIYSDFTLLQNQLFKINSYYRRICCYCIFNSNPKFIEIIKRIAAILCQYNFEKLFALSVGSNKNL